MIFGMNNNYAPLVIFAHTRPNKLAELMSSLELNPELSETDVFVYIDGPRNGHDDQPKILKVEEIIYKLKNRCKNLKVKISTHNHGVSKSVICSCSENLPFGLTSKPNLSDQ
jgi:hypothetical protein